ncbi:hypothetical protein CTYAZ2_38100 [Comamonas testosteroni]|nr:hypothetical protein CTYAZ2_38100 [Comamonas testosteroni]
MQTNAMKAGARTGLACPVEHKDSMARCWGDHLVCNPCEKWAMQLLPSRDFFTVPGSEVLLSLLPISTKLYLF